MSKTIVCSILTLFILTSGCATESVRPLQSGEALQIIGESVMAPGTPWKISVKAINLELPSGTNYLVKQLGIGTYREHPLWASSVLNAGISSLNVDPSYPNIAGEVIYIYSVRVGSLAAYLVENGKLDFIWLQSVKNSVRKEIIQVYSMRSNLSRPSAWLQQNLKSSFDIRNVPNNIRDISVEYQDKLHFWPGYIIAFGYSIDNVSYRVIHAIKYLSTSEGIVFQDFSFIRMENALSDRFDDFVAILKSSNLQDSYDLRKKVLSGPAIDW